MLLPRGDEYIVAVQNPRTAFGDRELQGGTPEVDQFGIPKPYSGGFTATFHLLNQSRDWAVRCFTRAISDLQQRYAAIDRFLERNTEGFLVETFYLSEGIRIGGQWYPIIKMQWVKGDTLNSFIEKNIGNAGRIKKLIPEFLALVRRLQHLKVAHGDLQHGNIIVRDGELFLIDYDGMFLPKLGRLKTNEIGHVNYQHPGRNASHYGPSIDRFSSIVIYLGLRGIAESPRLWTKYDDSENILLRAGDFINPAGSALLRELSALPALSSDVEKFQGVCKLPFDEVPDLETFLSGSFRYPEGTVSHAAVPAAPSKAVPRAAVPHVATPAPPPKAVPRSQDAPLDGANIDVLRRHIGQRVEVVGGVSQFHDSRKGRRPYMLLNFGAYPDHTFTLVLRPSALKAFQRSGADPQALVGKRIKVSGVLASYKGRPQMEVEGPAQVHVLGGGVVVQQSPGGAVATASRPHQQASGGISESIFDQLYAGRTSSPSPAGTTATHTPAPRPARSTPAQAPSRSHATPRPAHAAQVGRTRRKGRNILAGILVAVLLGVIAWAIWGIWGYVYAQ
jgi:hypothetical protein